MTDKNQSKPVREARAKARLMARSGAATYRQALDIVARDAGHDHWNAFSAAQADEGAATPIMPNPRFEPIPAYVRRNNGPIAITRDMATVQEYDINWAHIVHHVVCALTPLVFAVGGLMVVTIAIAFTDAGETRKAVMFLIALAAASCAAAPGVALLIRSFNATRIMLRRRRLMKA